MPAASRRGHRRGDRPLMQSPTTSDATIFRAHGPGASVHRRARDPDPSVSGCRVACARAHRARCLLEMRGRGGGEVHRPFGSQSPVDDAVDWTMSEDEVRCRSCKGLILSRFALSDAVLGDVRAWYLEHVRDLEAVAASHRPYQGVLGVIRWFQLQAHTQVVLNTGRAGSMRVAHARLAQRARRTASGLVRSRAVVHEPLRRGGDVSSAKVRGARAAPERRCTRPSDQGSKNRCAVTGTSRLGRPWPCPCARTVGPAATHATLGMTIPHPSLAVRAAQLSQPTPSLSYPSNP